MSLIADVFDVLIVQDNGDLIASTTLTAADINITQEQKEINAGRGDALIAVLHSKRACEINLSEITFKKDWIAYQLGVTATTAATTAWATSKLYTATLDVADVIITLDETPLASESGLQIYKTDGTKLALTTDYTVSGKKVTLEYAGAAAGDVLEVRGYKYTTAATATTLDINSTSFASGAIMVLETLELDEDETPTAKIQFIFDNVMPDGNVSIKTTSAKDASAFDMVFKAIKPSTSNSLGRMIRIPITSTT